jgi:hypothetical protein
LLARLLLQLQLQAHNLGHVPQDGRHVVHLELIPFSGKVIQQALQQRRLPLQPGIARMTAASAGKLRHAPAGKQAGRRRTQQGHNHFRTRPCGFDASLLVEEG